MLNLYYVQLFDIARRRSGAHKRCFDGVCEWEEERSQSQTTDFAGQSIPEASRQEKNGHECYAPFFEAASAYDFTQFLLTNIKSRKKTDIEWLKSFQLSVCFVYVEYNVVIVVPSEYSV